MGYHETEFDVPLTIKVRGHLVKGSPQTHWEPGEPAHFDEVVIETVEGQKISEKLAEIILTLHGDIIESMLYETTQEEAYERAISEAEHFSDLKEDR